MSYTARFALAAALMTLPAMGLAQTLPLTPHGPTAQTLPGLTLAQADKEAERAALAEFLPPAMDGWTREIVTELDQTQVAMLGEGYVVAADYRGPGGTINIAMMVDTPMIMQMAPMFQNAMMMALIGEPVDVAGHDFVATETREIIGMIDNRILISASGNAANGDSVIAYLEAVDFEALEAFNR